MLTCQVDAVWEPEVLACLQLHTHAELISNSVILGSELFLLLLMAGCIYMHNPGYYAFKLMYREVRDDLYRSGHA